MKLETNSKEPVIPATLGVKEEDLEFKVARATERVKTSLDDLWRPCL